MQDINAFLWQEIVAREGDSFLTQKGKSFCYHVKRNKAGELQGEIVIDGKRLAISRSTALLAGHRAIELQEQKGCVANHRKLSAFGSEYLYPVFLDMGICSRTPEETPVLHAKAGASEPAAGDAQAANPEQTAADAAAAKEPEQAEPELAAGTKDPENLLRICPACGFETREAYDFCPKCGQRLSKE